MKVGNKYFLYIYIMSFMIICCLCGCSKGENAETQTSADGEEIELMDPVGVAASYDVVQVRDLYDAEVYSCVCAPAITEFAYNSDLPFEKFGKLPGELVAEGDVLVYGETTELDEEYEELAEEIGDKLEDYYDEISDLQEDLYDAKEDEWEAWEPHQKVLEGEPSKNSAFYDMWARGSMPTEGAWKAAVMAREKVEQSIKEKEELFAIEQEYDQGRLNRIFTKIAEAHVDSDIAGTIVAINALSTGDVIPKNTSVIAVGDMSKKALYTEYISKAAVESAEDIYALVDGKRYEVTYEVMEKEEYTRLKRLNGTVRSVFYLNDTNDEIPMGEYVTLVFVKNVQKNALAVLSDALYKEGQDYYCHLYDGEKSTDVSVTVGMSDGLYTEIVSGLEEGDMVLTEKAVSGKGKMQKLEKGSLCYEYLGNGTLFYPSKTWIENPAEEGIFYLKEIYVEKYEQVEAGQALAKIEVISDDISIDRMERKIQRQQERLGRLLEKKSKGSSDPEDRTLERSIEARQKAIEDLNEELAELTQYTGEITLTAPYAGIITDVTDIETDELIDKGEKIVEMADQSLCYISLEDESRQLSLGKEATVSLLLGKSVEKEMQGTVVSVSGSVLSGQMDTGQVYISISEEDIAEIAKYGSTVNADGDWSRNRFEVRTQVRNVDNVVLVPQSAVEVVDNNTYVKVKNADGRITYASFIAGGLEQNYYWAADGLSEGMEICLE